MLLLFDYYVPFVPVRVHVVARTDMPPLPMTVAHLRTQIIHDCQNTAFVKKLNIPEEDVLLYSLQQSS